MQWHQTSLPIKAGGLGIRNVKSIVSLAFLAFVSKTKQLQNCLLLRCSKIFPDLHFDLYLNDRFKNNQHIQPSVGLLSTRRRSWDKLVIDKICGNWLQALPILHASQPDDHTQSTSTCNFSSTKW